VRKQPSTPFDVLDTNHRFLLDDTYHSLEWITNPNRPHGKEFYLVPMYKGRELHYATSRNDTQSYQEMLGQEVSKEFIESLPRGSFKTLVG
jgi:hypothetical protein